MMYEAITKVVRSKGGDIQLVDYTCAESILLDFVPSSRATVEETDAMGHHAGLGAGVKPFYVIFLELSGLSDPKESELLAHEVNVCIIFLMNVKKMK